MIPTLNQYFNKAQKTAVQSPPVSSLSPQISNPNPKIRDSSPTPVQVLDSGNLIVMFWWRLFCTMCSQVHIRIASPPLHFPCYMGINIPTRDELIANHLNLQQLAEHIGKQRVVYYSHIVRWLETLYIVFLMSTPFWASLKCSGL